MGKIQVLNIGKNRTQITKDDITVFVDYSTPVAAKIGSDFWVIDYFYSNTTSHHINQWLESFGVSKEDCNGRGQKFFDNLIRDIGVSL